MNVWIQLHAFSSDNDTRSLAITKYIYVHFSFYDRPFIAIASIFHEIPFLDCLAFAFRVNRYPSPNNMF